LGLYEACILLLNVTLRFWELVELNLDRKGYYTNGQRFRFHFDIFWLMEEASAGTVRNRSDVTYCNWSVFNLDRPRLRSNKIKGIVEQATRGFGFSLQKN
jgi:hypothetical protein